MRFHKSYFRYAIILSVLLFSVNQLYAQDGSVPGTPKIAYWKYGTDSTMVIVLHGGPGAAHNYLDPEWNLLSMAATVIYYDQRGTGKSGKADCYSWKEHVRDLKRLITQISDGKKVILQDLPGDLRLGCYTAILFQMILQDLFYPEPITG